MYEEWIKYEKITLEKPEVYEMAAMLKLDNHGVVGRLLVVWSWFDDYTEDGKAKDVMITMLDGKTCKGFCKAMASVGWLKIKGGYISISNYEKHNGASAKKRSNDRKRQQTHRSNTAFCHTNPVTGLLQMSHNCCDNAVTIMHQMSQQLCDKAVTFVTVARFSQFFFFFFLYQGGNYTTEYITKRAGRITPKDNFLLAREGVLV